MRKSFVLLVVCLLFLNMSRNSGSAAETENITAIRVATSPGYAPFEFLDDDKLVGYEVDVVKELEQRTGIKVNWEYADFSGLLGLLDSKRADMIAAQFSPTKERKQKYDFSDPINYYTKVIVVADNNNDIKGIDDLAGKKVGMGSGASDEKFLRDKFGENVNIEFYISATLENQYKDLEYGRIDAVIAQNIQIYQAIQKNSSLKIKVLESPISRSSACFALPKNNNELLKIINDFIKEARSDGTLKKISLKWLGADISEATGE